jgi:pSer/pThr/pTyr-binding forkhead associated (FHA) protein
MQIQLPTYFNNVTIDGIKVNNKVYKFIEIERPNRGGYIQLESIGDKQVIHVIRITAHTRVLKIGSSDSVDIKVYDRTVSPIHALIKVMDNGFMVEDNESKFGTLVKAPKEVILTNGKSIQIGKTILVFTLGIMHTPEDTMYSY